MPEIGIIIQARSGSTRFPKKILQNLPYNLKDTVLDQVIMRCKKVKNIKVILATTNLPEDDLLEKYSQKHNIAIFRGSQNDVLSRYYNSAKKENLDIVIRITSDCPFVDYNIIEEMINKFISEKLDYLSNSLPRTFPHGLDCEIFTFNALEKAYFNANKEEYREHVTPYLYKTGLFKINNYSAPTEFTNPEIRITLDTVEDYILLCLIADMIPKNFIEISMSDIINLFNAKPWIKLLNQKIVQKKVEFDSLEEEIIEAIKILDLQNLNNAKKILEDFLKRPKTEVN